MSLLSHNARRILAASAQRLRYAYYLFVGIGLLALAYSGFVFADARVYQAFQARKFTQASPLVEPHIALQGEVLGALLVPRLGLKVIVVQGDSAANLRRAVGHLSTSALPGEWGNVALAGHRDTFFRPLRNAQVGDEIDFTTAQQRLMYVVDSIQIVAPNDIEVLAPITGRHLTLITCYPFYFVGPAPKRFIVRAHEVDTIVREAIEKVGGITQGVPK
jgi:LPXTG-site transpeptidase (sortase) family protein